MTLSLATRGYLQPKEKPVQRGEGPSIVKALDRAPSITSSGEKKAAAPSIVGSTVVPPDPA